MKKSMYKAVIVFLFLILPISFVFADCAEDKLACYEDCNKECNEKKYAYCRTYEYSGCALDVFCDCNKCELFDSKWCPEEGYNACASGPIKKYETCIKSCQTDREAGKDVSTCWKDCNDGLTKGLLPCKDEQCENSCTAQGYDSGKWASYTQAGGYDTCACSAEKVKAPEPELFPEVTDDTEPPLDVMENSEPQPFPDIVESTKDPSDRYDGSSKLETFINLISGETIGNFFKYWFSSAENEGRKGNVGFVKAVKDKKGLRVFRNGKFYRVGVHTPLFPGDQLRTGPNAKMKLVLFNTDGTQDVIDIRSNSLFEVEGTRYEDHDDTIRIVKVAGNIIATVTRRIQGKKPNFYVKTHTVVAGIRGTEFYLSHDDTTNMMSLMVKEGKVELEGKTTVMVEAGEQIKAENGIFGEVEDLDSSKWDEVTEQDWDEVGKDGFFTIPAVKFFLVVIILVGGWFGYKQYSKKKRKKK